jgi:hypothetical protein
MYLRLLDDSEEDELAHVIRTEFIEKEKYCPSCCILNMARRLWIQNHQEETGVPQFSYHWLARFLASHHLSLRKPHIKRRSDPDDDSVCAFLAEIEWIMSAIPPGKVVNADETGWRVVDGELRTVANVGAESVTCRFPCDEKMSVTVIAAVSFAGDKLPLWVIAKGKTVRCESKIREGHLMQAIRSGRLLVTHSESGWMDKKVAEEYISWLRLRNSGPLALLWDVFAAHRDADVKDKAQEEEITVSFIPAGQTDEWQPLDRRIFGNLKQRAVRRWNRQFVVQKDPELSVNLALVNLMEAWESIGEDEVQEAWEHLT